MSTSHYDDESEFSYVESEVLARKPEPSMSQYSENDSHVSSNYSGGSVGGAFVPPTKAKGSGHTRDSVMSSLSQYSGTGHNHVAQPVSVTVVNQPVQPTVNRSLSGKRFNAKSYPAAGGSAPPQKLPTESADTGKLQPQMLYSTSIEGSIPPRSTRRPKSDVVDPADLARAIDEYQNRELPAHPDHRPPGRHSHSRSQQLPPTATGSHKKTFSISDDLDQLMERASSIKLKTYKFNQLSDDSSDDLREPKKSTESFKTASIYSTEERPRPEVLQKGSDGLPPRPSSEDLVRARQASSQLERTEPVERIEQPLPPPPVSYSDQESHYSDEPLYPEAQDTQASDFGQHSDHSERRIGLGLAAGGAVAGAATGIASTGVAVDAGAVSLNKSPRVSNKSTFSDNSHQAPGQSGPGTAPASQQELDHGLDHGLEHGPRAPDDYSPKGPISGPPVFDDENNSSQYEEPGYPSTQYEDQVDNNAIHPTGGFKTPEHNLLKPQQVPPPITQPQLHQPHLSHDNDFNLEDQYYDIDEPEVVAKPGRAKSVKDSTKHPKKMKRKSSKRKSGGKRDPSSQQLKPFSYHTLINLLESINGTIIGEEFNQLNLPIREKQLIEKIVDQLSRLTLDMVLDEQRYDIGIDRLERALKVLEGFM